MACPPLCRTCGGLRCGTEAECLFPWREEPGLIASYSAAHLLVGHAYSVLKKWKTRRGALFDRRILRASAPLRERWRETRASAVIPVPQRFERAWRLGGSPNLAIARWVGNETGIPVVLALAASGDPRGARQATLPRDARMANPLRFEAAGPAPAGPILLVDDFMTTGHTLRAAARALTAAGIGPVHAFCLGTRPEFVMREKSDHRARLVAGRAL